MVSKDVEASRSRKKLKGVWYIDGKVRRDEKAGSVGYPLDGAIRVANDYLAVLVGEIHGGRRGAGILKLAEGYVSG